MPIPGWRPGESALWLLGRAPRRAGRQWTGWTRRKTPHRPVASISRTSPAPDPRPAARGVRRACPRPAWPPSAGAGTGLAPWSATNACGPVGAALAYALRVGRSAALAAFGVPLAPALWCWNRLRGKPGWPLAVTTVLGGLLLFEVCTLLALGGADRWTWAGALGPRRLDGAALRARRRGLVDRGGRAVRRHGAGRERIRLPLDHAPRAPRGRGAGARARWALERVARARCRGAAKPRIRRGKPPREEELARGQAAHRRPPSKPVAVPASRTATTSRTTVRFRLPLPGLKKIEKPKAKSRQTAAPPNANAAAANAVPARSVPLAQPARHAGPARGPHHRRRSDRRGEPAGREARRLRHRAGASPRSIPGPVVTTFEFEPARRGQGQPDRLARGRSGAGAARPAHPHPRADPRKGRGRRRDSEPAAPDGVSA